MRDTIGFPDPCMSARLSASSSAHDRPRANGQRASDVLAQTRAGAKAEKRPSSPTTSSTAQRNLTRQLRDVSGVPFRQVGGFCACRVPPDFFTRGNEKQERERGGGGDLPS